MTYQKDKWIFASVITGLLAWRIGLHTAKPNHVEVALVMAWFCGGNFIAWMAHYNPPKVTK